MKCDNDCCCTNSKGVFDSSSGGSNGDEEAIVEALKKCGVSVDPSYAFFPFKLGLKDNCVVYEVKGKFNFVLANPSPYYRET